MTSPAAGAQCPVNRPVVRTARLVWLCQAEEPARFSENIGKAVETAAQRDQVEKIAMLAGGGVGLMFNCT